MSFIDELKKSQEEDKKQIIARRDKMGPYMGDPCPNCGRIRLMKGKDGGTRCEKCAWWVEANTYDYELYG